MIETISIPREVFDTLLADGHLTIGAVGQAVTNARSTKGIRSASAPMNAGATATAHARRTLTPTTVFNGLKTIGSFVNVTRLAKELNVKKPATLSPILGKLRAGVEGVGTVKVRGKGRATTYGV